MSYAQICFETRDLYTYSIPANLTPQPGQFVLAPFRNRLLKGLITDITSTKPDFKLKDIQEVLPEGLTPTQLNLAKWISATYFSPLYKSLRLFIPKNIWHGKQAPTLKTYTLTDSNYTAPARAAKQAQLLNLLKQKPYTSAELNTLGFTSTHLKPLLEKQVIQLSETATPLSPFPRLASQKDFTLTSEQTRALKLLGNSSKPSLLHGATGSGKTALYRELALQNAKHNHAALILVPEISLTPQLFSFFAEKFQPSEIAVWHSGLTERERTQIWHFCQTGQIKIVIGSRSALFLPLQNLKLIILDEEHEQSYKQDQSPRYDARTVAEEYAKLLKANLVFGSATPRLETYHRAKQGELNLVELAKSLPNAALPPELEIIDLKPETQRRDFKMLSLRLIEEIQNALDHQEQVLLFLNRRGLASSVTCRDCGYTALCPHCDTALTYHADSSRAVLLCHLCGHVQSPLATCPTCQGNNLRHLGGGTQKLEAELKELFPKARITRADRDTVHTHQDFQDLHESLHQNETDILIGTQMIAQGLDFPRIGLVGMVLADIGLHMPDFRTGERILNLLTQVSGRAGRREKQGRVLLQTFNPDHPLFIALQQNDYAAFYTNEIALRQTHFFPPFRRVAKLTFVHPQKDKAYALAQKTYKDLQALQNPGSEIFCAPALPPKQYGKYHWNVVVFSSNPANLIRKLTLPPEVRLDLDPTDTL